MGSSASSSAGTSGQVVTGGKAYLAWVGLLVLLIGMGLVRLRRASSTRG